MKVSVIIPFFYNSNWLFEAVQSVFNQTYKNLEIIVINDGSTENLDNFLNTFGDKIIYIEQKNSGPGTARNRGIEVATGDYICFQDSDDLWKPHKVQEQLKYMVDNNLLWSHTGGEYFTSNHLYRKTFNFSENSGDVALRSLLTMKIATPSVMIKADILKNNEIYRFNPKMRYSQDTFLYILLAQKYNLGYYDKECVEIRLRDKIQGNGQKNASRRFRIRFTGRRIINEYICSKENSQIHNVPNFISRLYNYYSLGDRLFTAMESNNKFRVSIIEFLAYICYAILHAVGNLYLFVYKNK